MLTQPAKGHRRFGTLAPAFVTEPPRSCLGLRPTFFEIPKVAVQTTNDQLLYNYSPPASACHTVKMAQEPAVEKKPKSFEALTPELSSWILDFAQSSGFARTTPVQAMAIPLLMGNKDLVVEVCGLCSNP